ncbi:MAG: tRNA U34 5-methylaminomethyl-2-thiouridine-forming methyltransferase MnmC [Hyphomicrobiaceae bacterium]|jgi:tRNA U34 5-methylaminomethyl-2-thiouridine-forming methyltransferase MnmC
MRSPIATRAQRARSPKQAIISKLMPNHSEPFAAISWNEGDTPVSIQFDDPYFAREGGRAETRHVFLAANDLPTRWQSQEQFTIAELGFGTGLNFFETLATWQREPGNCRHLRFVTFERYPMASDDLARALAPWPDLTENVNHLLEHWPPPNGTACHIIPFAGASLEIHLGDANQTVTEWNGSADAWYLDGFSPAKNPDLWSAELMAQVYGHTAPQGTFATYTAAGWVRRNLANAGFNVSKITGFGRKRHSLAGYR